jgi:hypothetical protein
MVLSPLKKPSVRTLSPPQSGQDRKSLLIPSYHHVDMHLVQPSCIMHACTSFAANRDTGLDVVLSTRSIPVHLTPRVSFLHQPLCLSSRVNHSFVQCRRHTHSLSFSRAPLYYAIVAHTRSLSNEAQTRRRMPMSRSPRTLPAPHPTSSPTRILRTRLQPNRLRPLFRRKYRRNHRLSTLKRKK